MREPKSVNCPRNLRGGRNSTVLNTTLNKTIKRELTMEIRFVALTLLIVATSSSAMEGYYSSPTLHGDTVIFTAEGDLWVHHLGIEQAERLTTHPSLETQARISPDGEQIAFAADYEGALEVYVMPVSGGVPKRLTYENSVVYIQEWTADGLILYSTNSRVGPPSNFSLKTVNPQTLEVEFIPLADASGGSIDEHGDIIYFTQFGGQIAFDNTNTYRGGMLGKLWRYRLGLDDEATRIAEEHEGSIRRPMVSGDNLYFISDASGRDNIWSMDIESGIAEQITQHEDLSIRGASMEGGRVIYQLGADLYLLDLVARESRKLDIQLASDHPGLREQWITDPLKYITSARLSGDFEKVVVTARGKAAIAGIDQARLITVGSPTTTRLRRASLSHDGKSVYAISDTSGELELWRYDATGATTAEQLTEDGGALRADYSESPDGRWIVHDDGNGGLWLLDTNTKQNRQIVNNAENFQKPVWSPDSKLVAVAHVGPGEVRPRILLYDINSDNQSHLTSGKYESGSPVFSRDGKWLYFLSDRHFETSFASTWQDRDFGPAFNRRTEVFAHALTDNAEFPFAIPTELTPKETEQEDQNGDEAGDSEVAKIAVAWEGLEDRVWQVPIEPGNYADLLVNDEYLYLQSFSSAPGVKPEIKVMKLEPQSEPATFTDNVAAMDLSDDGKKLFVMKQSEQTPAMFIVPAGEQFPDDVSKNTVQASGWQFSIDPRLEWEQIFHDAWLMHREQFFDAEMRGLDWEAIKEKYMPLVARTTDRRELNDIFGQMMGELNALHSAVRGGDLPLDPDSPKPAALGAKLGQTRSGVAVDHIYRFDAELPAEAPPLAKPGVDAAVGDVISAINGIETPTLESVHRALRNQAGKQVLLQLQRGRDELKTVVVPVESREDYSLRYNDWVTENRIKVEAEDADLGYVHIRSMVNDDAASFAREFYANTGKKGMVIDVRRNNGGNIDSWIIDRLLRKAWSFWTERRGTTISTNMQNAFRGHVVVIADERTYSDGETFVAAIKALDIAPVIGKRTAGAGVWLSPSNRVVDNGIARVAQSPVFDLDGEWIVEGYGINPTIEVDNLPHATFNGADAQLEAAIKYLQQKIEQEPIPELNAKPFPENGQPAGE